MRSMFDTWDWAEPGDAGDGPAPQEFPGSFSDFSAAKAQAVAKLRRGENAPGPGEVEERSSDDSA